MAATSIATNVLALASLEYLRKVTLDRIEKSPCGFTVYVDINEPHDHCAISVVRDAQVLRSHESRARKHDTLEGHRAGAVRGPRVHRPERVRACTRPSTPPGPFRSRLERLPSGNLKVTWSANPETSASIDCPPDDSEPPYDPPPVPGMPGPSLLAVDPTTFELPASGGLQVIGGGIDAGGGDGVFHSGSLLVSLAKP